MSSFTGSSAHHRLTACGCVMNWCSLMIDRAIWRELAAMLYARAENPNQAPSDAESMLLADDAEETSGRPVRQWYEALLPRRSAF